jgi:hypothetical protein
MISPGDDYRFTHRDPELERRPHLADAEHDANGPDT